MKEGRSDTIILILLIVTLIFVFINLNPNESIFDVSFEEDISNIDDNNKDNSLKELSEFDDNNKENVSKELAEVKDNKENNMVELSKESPNVDTDINYKKDDKNNNTELNTKSTQSTDNKKIENTQDNNYFKKYIEQDLQKKYEEKDNTPIDYTQSDIYYYYNNINSTQRELYDRIAYTCSNFENSANLNMANLDDVYIAETAVSYDHPEFYWMKEFSLVKIGEKVKSINFDVPKDAKEKMELIDSKVNDILSGINKYSDDYQKVKYFYDWIIENTDYENLSSSQDFTSVFLDKRSVCAGYSRAFQYLCQKANIECSYVVGIADNNELHAWNLVKIGKNYYWVDTTWGDPVFSNENSNSTNYN